MTSENDVSKTKIKRGSSPQVFFFYLQHKPQKLCLRFTSAAYRAKTASLLRPEIKYKFRDGHATQKLAAMISM